MRQDNLCGVSFWHPKWLQRYATTKWFLGTYGLLGTVQAMSYMYMIVTLTTIEKRFHMPSQTTGIVLSGNEISQILFSLIISYIGDKRNRPLWLAWGMVLCGISCFVLATPHFIYGLGDEAFRLTQEYYDQIGAQKNLSIESSMSSSAEFSEHHSFCNSVTTAPEENCNELVTVVPLVLIFLSQFILGIGNTLYYSLGQTYLDDNTKKTNTPLMLAYAMTLRMIGPIFGFFLGFATLNMYVDPSKTPLINRNDPRWLGAWWFGWIILGSIMLLFSGLIGLFPKELSKNKEKNRNKIENNAELQKSILSEETVQLYSSETHADVPAEEKPADLAKLKDFPKALARLLKNKLLIFNNISGIFYILGASGYMTFMSRYMEVQFQKTAQSATIIIGPLTIFCMVIGLLGSGWFISKKQPSVSKVLFWNVIVGGVYMCGQFSQLFFYCGNTDWMIQNGTFNLTSNCNQDCNCTDLTYSPICHESSGRTFFSPCHAGCNSWDDQKKIYTNCSCNSLELSTAEILFSNLTETNHFGESSFTPSHTAEPSTILTTLRSLISPIKTNDSAKSFTDILTPGACLEGCTRALLTFQIFSIVLNILGSSGRIGNILVNYRAVAAEDKSFAQGLTLMMVSLFALIPGPIIFGRVIDSTCLVWKYQCGQRGDCQLYDQTRFRYYVNLLAITLTTFGVIFDFLVWLYGKNLNFYGEIEELKPVEIKEKKQVINNLDS